MQEGQATTTYSVARPTVNEMTMTLNTAENIVWTEVNTGGSPIDPPGWQEVA